MEKSLFVCPHCRAPLTREGGSLFCGGAKRHCFDLAGEGYVNLTLPGAAGGGDDSALIQARRTFLQSGHYQPVAEMLTALLDRFSAGNTLLDAGCGEGYYTNFLAARGYRTAGVDLSKKGVRAAAKQALRAGLPAQYAVAGIFALPVADGSMDGVVSLFAPICESEFLRVLRRGGLLITAGAGRDHLKELKTLLYDRVYENEPRADLPQGMTHLCHEELAFDMELTGEEARALFAMTPYYYRTPAAGRARLEGLTELHCRAQVAFEVYRA